MTMPPSAMPIGPKNEPAHMGVAQAPAPASAPLPAPFATSPAVDLSAASGGGVSEVCVGATGRLAQALMRSGNATRSTLVLVMKISLVGGRYLQRRCQGLRRCI